MRLFRTGPAAWMTAGVVGWMGILWIGLGLWNKEPPRAGFDLALLLEAARRVVAGQSPYDPAMLAGGSPEATGLFYSYPPPVAQAMTLFSGIPDGVVLLIWAAGATVGLALVAWRIGEALNSPGPATALHAVAVAPLVLPFAVALLFGNFDVWYPLAYGVLVLAVLPGASRPTLIAGGIAVAVISVAKLHPAVLLVWVAVRAVTNHGGPAARVFGAAAVAGTGIVVTSLAVWGTGPWLDYVEVLRASAGAEIVDPRNLAPVSLLGQAAPLDAGTLRLVQVGISGMAVIASAIAAVRVRDPLSSLSVAIVASMLTLPVTWYHYPVALIPVCIVLAVVRPRTRPLILVAVLIADLAISFGPLLWVAVAVLMVAVRDGRASTSPGGTPVPVTGRTTPH